MKTAYKLLGVCLFGGLTLIDVKGISITLPGWLRPEPESHLEQKPPENPVIPVTPDRIKKNAINHMIIPLRSLSSDSYKLDFIEDNIDSIPDSLSLKELNAILAEFGSERSSDSYKVDVIEVLGARIKVDLADSTSIRKLGDLFSRDSYKRDAYKLLFGGKNKR